jgi:hemolysin activation/secretion protein
LGFVDIAKVTVNRPLPGEKESQTVGSVGLGLRAALGTGLSARMDWGYVTQGTSGKSGPAAGDNKLHATMTWVF